jgi:hypothetical protein
MTAGSTSDADNPADPHAGLWPSADYHAQVARLRAAVGERIYLAELRDTDTQLGAQITDRPYELLGVMDFPRPDPARGLAPHLILLDDGRGVNLGRIARISRRPFQPAADEVLYLDRAAHQTLLFADRRLSKAFIAERAQAALGQVLGYGAPSVPRQLGGGAEQPADAARSDSEDPSADP